MIGVGVVRKKIIPYLYVLPAIIVFIVFKYWPMFFGSFLSFSKWNFIGKIKWAGLANFKNLFASDLFVSAVVNTVKYTLVLVPVYIVVPLLLAILILRVKNSLLSNMYKILIFMPTILSFAITCMVWMWIFNPSFGALNTILGYFGVDNVFWLSDDRMAFWSIVLVSSWKTLGYNMIIYIAGLSAISPELIEAAYIDGANSWQTFWRVKWPLLSPMTYFILITSFIYATDKAFIPINILTKGGPHEVTTNLAYSIYVYGFEIFNIGAANAVSILTFIAFLAITFILIKTSRKWVNYEN